jgi:hypothetical protein
VVLSGGYAWAVGVHWTGVDEDHGAFSPISAALWEFYEDMRSSVVLDPVKLPTSPAPSQVTINGPSTVGPNAYACSSWSVSVQGQPPFEYLWSSCSV